MSDDWKHIGDYAATIMRDVAHFRSMRGAGHIERRARLALDMMKMDPANPKWTRRYVALSAKADEQFRARHV